MKKATTILLTSILLISCRSRPVDTSDPQSSPLPGSSLQSDSTDPTDSTDVGSSSLSLVVDGATSEFFRSSSGQAYYANASGSGSSLLSALGSIISGHSSQSYGSLLTHYKSTDSKPNNVVWDMYSDKPGGTPSYVYYHGSKNCGNYDGEGDCYNREHSFPQSWFESDSPMVSDLFHVYPTDGYVNGRRGNYPYGEVASASWTSTNGSRLGSAVSGLGYSGTVFEPIDEYKGDFARSYFYMAARYKSTSSGWGTREMFVGGSSLFYKEWAYKMLLKWHSQDPVSSKEYNRNDAVYKIQKNRNPFIDNSEYAHLVWGDL